MTPGVWPAWYELAEAACIAGVILLPLARVWSVLDRRSRAAAAVRRWSALPGMEYAFPAVVAAGVFFITAEDVLDGSPNELLVVLDGLARDAARVAAAHPLVHRLALEVSAVTGAGLIAALLTGCLGLWAVGRARDAAVVGAGSLGAWALSAALKLTFGVPRPRLPHSQHAITGYGFPSAHALLAVVVCGLLAWTVTRDAGAGGRWLRAAVIAMAGLTAGARLVLDMHWLTDVLAGAALGIVWLNLVLMAEARLRPRTAA